ncbi:hypothetical protein Tco_0440585, partial [Tanacetum coccineum]
TDPSLRPSPSIAIPDFNPEGSGGNHGGSSQEAWMKSVALKTRLERKTSLKKKGVQKEYVSKQGRKSIKSSKGEPYVHKDSAFDGLDDDAMDYMETRDA